MKEEFTIECQEDLMSVISMMETGIWFVEELPKDGSVKHFLVKRLEDLPEAMRLSSFDKIKTRVAKAIKELLDHKKKRYMEHPSMRCIPSTLELVDTIRNIISKQKE